MKYSIGSRQIQVDRPVLVCLVIIGLFLACTAGALATDLSHWTAETLPQPPNSGNGHEAYGVSCIQPKDCIAVGGNWNLDLHTRVTLAERWDGKAWTVLPTPNPPGLNEGWKHQWYAVLSGVSCVSASNCIAVGRYRDAEEAVKPLAERWDGGEWTITTASLPSAAAAGQLEAVSCISGTACTAVGYFENVSGTVETLAERWDGSEWSIEPTPSPGEALGSRLLGVSCPTITACTAVGFNHGLDEETTLAEHWNGDEWLVQATADPGGMQPSNRLSGVSCSSSAACTAVGRHEYKLGAQFLLAPLAERWEGSNWSTQTTPEPVTSEQGGLSSVWCVSSSSCTAVGDYREIEGADSSAEVLGERWDGTTWSVLNLMGISDPPGWWHESWLYGVACAKAEACTAVGAGLSAPSGALSPYRALGEHEGRSPTASFSFTPSLPDAGQSVTFDASPSTEPGHTITDYSWDFGDGSHGDGQAPTHTYTKAGDYTVTLAVTDDEENSGQVSRVVPVAQSINPGIIGIGLPSEGFSIRHVVARCDGRIAISLDARRPGRVSAVATAIPDASSRHPRGAGNGRCNTGRPGVPSRRDSKRVTPNGRRRIPYGSASAVAATQGVVRLTILPRHGTLAALARLNRFQVGISISFSEPDGTVETAHRWLRIRR